MRGFKLALGIGMLGLTTMACGESGAVDAPHKVEPGAEAVAAATVEDEAQPTAAEAERFQVGDAVALADHQITLESVTRDGENNLVAIFVVENTGGKNLTVSSLMSFEAKDDAGNKGKTALLFDSDTGGLDGTVLAGDKLRGHVAWSGLGSGVRIHYTPKLLGDTRVTWEAGQ